MRVLLIDIETSPNLAYVWGAWEQNININAMVSTSSILCWSAKWLDDKRVMFDSVYESGYKKMLKGIHQLLNEADVVVHYNGKRFDIPTLNREFLLNGMMPPAPYKQVDMLQVTRSKFKFLYNKLDYVARKLKLGGKTKHGGFQLWLDCMAKKPEAWATMKKYNKHDIVLLEGVYRKMLPWIDNHPNRSAYQGGGVCTNCGSKHAQRRGYEVTRNNKYQRLQCVDCGTWFRDTKAEPKSGNRTFSTVRG